MKAVRAVGLVRAIRFVLGEIIRVLFVLCVLPPMRTVLLRFLGARIGAGTVIHRFEFINFYRGSFRNLAIGSDCYIGSGVLFDLADTIVLEKQVTLSERTLIITHRNVGYNDHPLQASFPPVQAPVTIKSGSFIGVNTTILHGVTIGPKTLVAAGAVVTRPVDGNCLVGGVPARTIRTLSA